MIDDEPTLVTPRPTRRERRLQQRPRRLEVFVGWLGYGLSVFVVVTVAAWMAVRGDSPGPAPTIARTRTEPTVETRGVETVASTTPEVTAPPTTPAPVPAAPSTAPSTTTTTAPLLAAAVAPEP